MKIQLNLPARNQKNLAFCNSNDAKKHLKATETWQKNLPITDLIETGNSLVTALDEIARLDCSPDQLFQLAEKLHSPAITACFDIHQRYLERAITFDSRQQEYFELCNSILQKLATVYRAVVQSCLDHKQQGDILAKACHRALADESQIYLLDCQLYRPTPKGFWLELHTLYRVAEQFKLLDFEQADSHSDKKRHLSITNIYKRTLLISRSRYNKLTPEEIRQTWNALAIWSPHCKISPKSGLRIYFAVNLAADEGMHYAAPDPDKPTKGVFGVDARVLASHLGKLRDKPDANSTLSPQLISHLASAWSQISRRQHKRQSSNQSCDICPGFIAAHYQLSGGQDFNQLTAPHVQSADSEQSTFDHDKDDVWSGVKDLEAKNKEKLPTEKTEAVIDFNNADGAEDGRYKPLSVKVINTSASGYCLQLSSSSKLKVGDPLVLRENSRNNTAPWLMAAIRWIEVQADQSIKIGVELLSAKSEPCAISLIHKQRQTSHFQRCFLLPDIPAIAQLSSLIIPQSDAKSDQKFELLHNGEIKKGQLTKCISSTAVYSEYQYRLFE